MKLLCFDTETSGKLIDARASDSGQPHIVQLAALLVDVDDNWNELEAHNHLVSPDGWEIPAEATAIHGITNERAKAEGIPEIMVAQTIQRLVREADVVVAHNISFDRQIARIALRRFGIMREEDTTWGIEGKEFCTMKFLTPVCRIPKPTGYGNKWPKLSEAYQFCFGEELAGAHDALNDVRATLRLYRWIQENQRKEVVA